MGSNGTPSIWSEVQRFSVVNGMSETMVKPATPGTASSSRQASRK